MAEAAQDFNPFQAPRVHEPPEQRLAEDQQFLISRRDIICREKVELPQLCIHTGEVENLVKRQKTLYAPSGATLAVLIITACFVVLAITIGFQAPGMLFLGIAALVGGSIRPGALWAALLI